MKTKIVIILLLNSLLSFSQSPEGYWDNQRITNKEIKLSAGNKVIFKSEDLPIGTTEFVYRITLLDENQKMVNDLASVLKAIPDPYFIGKGTGGALSLASGISGSDKCTYAIFSDESKANEYTKSSNNKLACLYQPNPVNKDAKVVSVQKSTCLSEDSRNIWFVFENQNWIMNEKIVVEIVPWIDNVASRGWNQKNKQLALDKITKFDVFNNVRKDIGNSVKYAVLNNLMTKYRFQDFTKLNESEQSVFIEKKIAESFDNEGYAGLYNEFIGFKAHLLAFKENKFDEAIAMIETKIMTRPKVRALDYNLLAELYLWSNQFGKSLQALQIAEKLDSSELKVKLNMAHVYMFTDEVAKAKEIHKRYMSQNISAKQTWKNKAVNDLDAFKKSSLPKENISKIWRLYN